MNDGFRILERSNALFRILECPEFFVRLSLFMNNGTKDRTNYSRYSRIRNNAFDLWVSGDYECCFPYTTMIERNIRDTRVSRIFRSTLLSMNNGYKDRMNSSGYSRIRNNAFDV